MPNGNDIRASGASGASGVSHRPTPGHKDEGESYHDSEAGQTQGAPVAAMDGQDDRSRGKSRSC